MSRLEKVRHVEEHEVKVDANSLKKKTKKLKYCIPLGDKEKSSGTSGKYPGWNLPGSSPAGAFNQF